MKCDSNWQVGRERQQHARSALSTTLGDTSPRRHPSGTPVRAARRKPAS